MKFLILGERHTDSNAWHMADSLRFLGHEVVILPLSESMPKLFDLGGKWSKKAWWYLLLGFEKLDIRRTNRMIDLIEPEAPDVLINLYWSLHPSFTGELRKRLKQTRLIHVNSDAVSNFERQQLFLSDYDFYYSKDPFIQDFMKNMLGLPAFYLPEYCNPRRNGPPANISKKEAEVAFDCDVAVYGNIYPYRTRMLSQLKKQGISLKIYGNKGPYFSEFLEPDFQQEYIKGDRKSEILYGSKVVFNNLHYAEIEGVNQKYFEIFGAGGCQVVSWKAVMADYSPIDPAYYSFKNLPEAVERIHFFLENPGKRWELSETMSQHFMQHHSIDNRMKTILDNLND